MIIIDFTRKIIRLIISIFFKIVKSSIFFVARLKVFLYWKVVGFRNQAINQMHFNRSFNLIRSISLNLNFYIAPLVGAIAARVLGRKIITVFFLTPAHWAWVKTILIKMNGTNDYLIQIFYIGEPPLVEADVKCENIKYYSMNGLRPTLMCYPLVPALISDLYLTPSSASARMCYLKCPKIVFMHSLVDIQGVYEVDSFDEYDYVYCAGYHHTEEFIEYFSNRKLTGKCLIPGGYPRLDEQISHNSLNGIQPSIVGRILVIAPSLLSLATEKDSLLHELPKIIESLTKAGWHIIFRPHPINMVKGNPYEHVLRELINSFRNNELFELDISKDYSVTYERACLILSDLSGTAYTFAFGFLKPAVFYEVEQSNSIYAHGLLSGFRTKLGDVAVGADNVLRVVENCYLSRHEITPKIFKTRRDIIYNLGFSANYFLNNIHFIFDEKHHSEWVYL